ncbi:hypothetical protein EJM73_08935 [Clostridium botulinum]|uniref:hypothetical protein n=1 Tax=Clostridium botulinum TaxID=1491 RepID=UPI0013754FAA|nr:hypothetical protein [Clostridium botulinum]NCI19749.1 hypothetical protein [Clostridium botulinum]NCI35787.1 hypothetical protein [Clostridium botulinum]NCI71644.1 hypothetical protein [Clostridium botulinum]NDI38836.1 hypothetical protein [Clostridium botulinum]
MKVEAKALVTYTCYLTEEDEEKVQSYAKEQNISLDEAIEYLWENEDINIYAGDQTESDCWTQEVTLLDRD